MPFLQHFGLKEYPFALTPDTSLFFPAPDQEQILSALMFALGRGDGVLKVVGEVGTGKTLLCRILLHELDRTETVAYLNAPITERHLLPAAICREFGVELAPGDDPIARLTAHLVDVHSKGRRAVVVVDEAQALGPDGLETIRLLSNLETDKRKLLQIVLFGQPELDELLNRHNLRQLLQRINFSFTTRPLTPRLGVAYVEHRLRRVQTNDLGREIIPRWLLHLLVRQARGVPRVINILADKALLAAYGEGARRVAPRHLRAALRDSAGIVAGPLVHRGALLGAAVAGTVMVAVTVAWQAGLFAGGW